MSYSDLGRLVKAKYPEYSDMSDDELGKKVYAKYPQYKDIVEKAGEAGAIEKTVGFLGGPIVAAALKTIRDPKGSMDQVVDLIRNTAKTGVQLTAQNPAIAEIAGIFGGEKARSAVLKPRNVPGLGEVKPVSAAPGDSEKLGTQTSAETAAQAGGMFLEAGAPGVGKVLSAVGKNIKKVGPFSKWAEALSNVPARKFEKAATPEMSKAIKEVRDLGLNEGQISNANIGEQVYTVARDVKKSAQESYKAAREALIKDNKGSIIQRSRKFVDGVTNVLTENKISISDEGVDLVGSQFEGSKSAENFLDRAYKIMTRPLVNGTEAVDDLLTRREAITSILDEVPVVERNLRRVLMDMRKSFDSTLDDVLGSGATELREDYKKAIRPSQSIIDAMTTKRGPVMVFSPDKSANFIRQATNDLMFDKRAMLEELDNVVGSQFAKTVEAIGIDRAISQLDPPTRGRIFDVLKVYVGAKLPIISALFSPRAWGEYALNKGKRMTKKDLVKASVMANKFKQALLINLLSLPIRNAGSTDENQ